MSLNRYLPIVLIYFFVNSVALPFGLTYTALLAPLFYAWIVFARKREVVMPFITILAPFIIAHVFLSNIDEPSYFLSLLNLLLVYIFCQAVYTFLKTSSDPGKFFYTILVINFILCLAAIPVYFSSFSRWWWLGQTLSEDITGFRRLKLFTYEPSYYAMLWVPVLFFFLFQYLLRQNRVKGSILFVMLALPYLLSFSFGVIASVVLAFAEVWIIHFSRLTRKKRMFNFILNAVVMLVMTAGFILFFFPKNPVFARGLLIFSGDDSSGNGRTVDAFILASKLLKETNEYWGVGLGQVKLAGSDIIRNYYLYYRNEAVAIPNAAAETLAIFGWIGFILRLLIEVILFYYTKVWKNYYRLALFLFIFMYQFTGSFITNAAEYVIWIIAFTNAFPQFRVKQAALTGPGDPATLL